MQNIQLSTVPNQAFFTNVNGIEVSFVTHIFKDVLYCDIGINGERLASSVPCVPNGWLIPDNNAKSIGGNFRFDTQNGEYPHPDNFGTSCNLVFYDDGEIADME